MRPHLLKVLALPHGGQMEIKPLIHGYLEDIPNPNYSSSFEFDSP
jgi:hypothetical protein